MVKLWIFDDDIRFNVIIIEINLCKDDGRTYVVYIINVYRVSLEGIKFWIVFRRYSDFDDLYLYFKEKFGLIFIFFFFGKRIFYNLDKKFLEKRRNVLDAYL